MCFVSPGYDVSGPVAIGVTHWKNPYAQGRPTVPSDLPLFVSKDAGIPVYHQSLTRKAELATPLSCPASLSITPVPSYSSSSQETLSQDTTGKESWLPVGDSGLIVFKVLSFACGPDCICVSACVVLQTPTFLPVPPNSHMILGCDRRKVGCLHKYLT